MDWGAIALICELSNMSLNPDRSEDNGPTLYRILRPARSASRYTETFFPRSHFEVSEQGSWRWHLLPVAVG